MGHCVGDANMGYMDGVRDGEIKILSLRRPGSKPLFTMEAELRRDAPLGKMSAQGMIKTFDQIKGKGNRKPGFDRGLDRNIYQSKAEAEPAIKAFKRDEVQKVIEFLDEKPNHWDGRFLDIADLQPALFVISALVKENDPWALELLRKYPTLLGAEPNKWVVITEAGAREWTAADESHARDQHMQAFPDEEILSIEHKTPAGPVAPVEPVRVVPLWAVVMATGVERAFAAATEEEAYELAARAYPDENIVGIRRTNPASSCGHGACDGFCLPYRRRVRRNPPIPREAAIREFLDMIRDEDPSVMEIAQDLALENKLSLAELGEAGSARELRQGGGGWRGEFLLSPEGAPRTSAGWSTYNTSSAGSWATQQPVESCYSYLLELTWRGGDEWNHPKQGYMPSFRTLQEVRRAAAADAWAVAKFLKELSPSTPRLIVAAQIPAIIRKLSDTTTPPELYEHRGGKPKRQTYAIAQDTAIGALRRAGWKVSGMLKVRWAESPSGWVRLWFRPQSVSVSHRQSGSDLTAGRPHTLGDARAIDAALPNLRDMTGSEFVEQMRARFPEEF